MELALLGPVTADLPRAVWQPTNSHDRLLDLFGFALAAACKGDLLADCKVASASAQHALPCIGARPFLFLSKQFTESDLVEVGFELSLLFL